ncbi:type VI secretion system-associated FHA domain protein TagH [Pseudomonas trivialis]|uniref:FHA domain protein n=1 Tax=Pseudomonas trivialis TaxID=200450 RepID=A0A0R2ZEJ7_9PSED|nr:type VI secretion system-associated FHA domain protein TagH [Pseudomonas trivialis]KRP58605.1 type VI secretion protein [Pseudomonas trivialis]SDS75907.1 FHA domain protein [Pseudomonas trivialis]
MQLVFEVYESAGADPASTAPKLFTEAGGVIGRGAGCDWVIHDPSRLLSSHHGLVSFREGQYFLTDISRNGICMAGSGERLCKGQARLVEDGDVFQLGALSIRARLVASSARQDELQVAVAGQIPDDAFLGLDPIPAMDQARLSPDDTVATSDEPAQRVYQQAPDRDYMSLPRRVEPVPDAPPIEGVEKTPALHGAFWGQFSAALGLDLEGVDTPRREALAIRVACLLKQSIEGLQQSLRTCDELKNASNLAPSEARLRSANPLRHCSDGEAALAALLGMNEQGQLPAEAALVLAHRDLQSHQVALLTACRTALRNGYRAFAPSHLMLCFERQAKAPRFNADGAHWRAYQRHYQRLVEEEPLSERLLGNDFAKAYEEQVRLISTLHAACPG